MDSPRRNPPEFPSSHSQSLRHQSHDWSSEDPTLSSSSMLPRHGYDRAAIDDSFFPAEQEPPFSILPSNLYRSTPATPSYIEHEASPFSFGPLPAGRSQPSAFVGASAAIAGTQPILSGSGSRSHDPDDNVTLIGHNPGDSGPMPLLSQGYCTFDSPPPSVFLPSSLESRDKAQAAEFNAAMAADGWPGAERDQEAGGDESRTKPPSKKLKTRRPSRHSATDEDDTPRPKAAISAPRRPSRTKTGGQQNNTPKAATSPPEGGGGKAKDAHNHVEQQYRKRLNTQFERLIAVLPQEDSDGEGGEAARKMSKGEVLDQARRRIQVLEQECVLMERQKNELKGDVERLQYGRGREGGPAGHGSSYGGPRGPGPGPGPEPGAGGGGSPTGFW